MKFEIGDKVRLSMQGTKEYGYQSKGRVGVIRNLGNTWTYRVVWEGDTWERDTREGYGYNDEHLISGGVKKSNGLRKLIL